MALNGEINNKETRRDVTVNGEIENNAFGWKSRA